MTALTSYKTLAREAEAEIIIKKSRFIGRARPVASEEEAIRFIEAVKKEHWSATHNCSAYVVGDNNELQKQSDDGEPSGTAGRPILEVIKNMGLKYTAVVVTRYFGGIKLGASGLIRAYAEGAQVAIQATEPIYQVLHEAVNIQVAYTWHGKLENELRNAGVMIEGTDFSDVVTYRCLPVVTKADNFIAWVTDLTHGQAQIERGERRYIAHRSFDEDTVRF